MDHLKRDASYKELLGMMNSKKYHIFHFIGHGRPGGIALKKDTDELRKEIDLAAAARAKPKEANWLEERLSKSYSLGIGPDLFSFIRVMAHGRTADTDCAIRLATWLCLAKIKNASFSGHFWAGSSELQVMPESMPTIQRKN